MENILDEAVEACPLYNTSQIIRNVYNISKFANNSQLAQFACEYAELQDIRSRLGYWNGAAYVFGCAFGIPSAILAIVIFYRKEFDTVSFFYHRVINIIELVYMGFVFESALQWLTDDVKNRSWTWCQYLRFFHYKLDLALPLTIELIIIWVAVERVALCFTSHWFTRINQKSTARLIVSACLIVSICLYLPTAFTSIFVFNNATRMYTRLATSVVDTTAYKLYIRFWACYSFVRFALMSAATIATILGLLKISKRKRKLIASAGYKSANAQQLLRQININSQLCLLQLCESVPVLANCFVLVVLQSLTYTIDTTKLVSMPYDQASHNLGQATIYVYFSIIQTIVDLVEHSTHFYRYFIFSHKVQTTVRGMLKKNTVSQLTKAT